MENVMYYAGIVEDYYNAARPSYTRNGYEKNVLIDMETEKCIFVSGEVTPQDNELLFRLKTAGGQTISTLKTPKLKKSGKGVNGNSANRTYEGLPNPTTWDNQEATYVYLPDVIYNEYPMTVKVSNLDAFLKECMAMDGRNCNPYEVLDWLDRSTTTESPFGLPKECVELPFQNEKTQGVFVFRFKCFEELAPAVYDEHGAYMCATFDYAGTRDVKERDNDTLEF